MPKVLELAELIEYDQVAEGQVRPGRVHAQLDPQRSTAMQAILKFCLADDCLGIGANGIDQTHCIRSQKAKARLAQRSSVETERIPVPVKDKSRRLADRYIGLDGSVTVRGCDKAIARLENLIGSKAHGKMIPQCSCLLKKLNMPAVENIIAT